MDQNHVMQQKKQPAPSNEMPQDTMGAVFVMIMGSMIAMMAFMTLLTEGIKIFKQEGGGWVPITSASVAIALSAVILWHARSLFQDVDKQKKLRSQFPNEPWRWKPEWTGGVVVDSPGILMGCFGYTALFWNAFGTIALIEVLNRNPFAEDKKAYLIFLVPLIGLAMLGCFVYFYFQNRKYGKSQLRLKTFPGVIGEEFVAVLTIPTTVLPSEGIRVKLENSRTVSKGSSLNDHAGHSTTTTFWEEEKTLTSWKHFQRQTIIEMSFQIPAEGRPTTMDLHSNFEWGLIVEIKTAGTDYWASFEVPIFDLDNFDSSSEIDNLMSF